MIGGSINGISVGDVQSLVEIAVGAKDAGLVFEGDRRLERVVRLPDAIRSDVEALRNLPVPLPAVPGQATAQRAAWGNSSLAQARTIPLSAVAEIEITFGPNRISRENGKRRIVVSANVRDRDLGSFVAEAQAKISESVELPAAYWIGWDGQFEQLASAS